MARRIINKACNDLVGGAGTDVSVNLGSEIPRKPSVLKLASRDPNHGYRQAFEVKPIDGRQVPKGPLQMVHPSRRDNVKLEEKRGNPHFVTIDGDGSVKQVDASRVQQPKAGPQTAYKTRSFMSSVDLGPRGHPRPQTQLKQNPVKPSNPPPRREPIVPTVSHQPHDGKMFLPKGIHQTDQPYVVPKFMPSYREMMVPKPRPDPLVSIVENTPPSLQKWAIEWNSEPKKTISIDELKEDLIREAAENSHKPPGRSQQVSSIYKPNPVETHEDQKSDEPNNNLKNQSSYVEPVEKSHPNASVRGNNPPWNDIHVPESYETLNPEQQKIGRPLVDWVPPKYSSLTKRFPNSHRDTEYSFQEAINNGTPKKTSMPEPAKPKLFFPKSAENAVYYDTEEERFHDWFKERMSTAAQSAANRPKAMPKNSNEQFQAPHLNSTCPAIKDPSKPGNMASANPIGPNKLAQAERDPINNSNQSNRLNDLDDVVPPEVRAHPEHANNKPVTSYEPESNSSFYHWLKLRGYHIAKNELNSPENKTEQEKTKQRPQNASLFPWSVSYTIRKRVSTPTLIPKRVAIPAAVPKRSSTAENLKKSQKPVSQGDTTLKPVKQSIRKSVNSIGHRTINNAVKKSHKTIVERSVKSARKKSLKSNSKVYIKNSNKKMPKAETPRVPTSPEHSWLNDSWNVDSEIDHVNNVRKMEIFGNSPKSTNMKKLYPSMGGQQMKYWESKYIKKPELAQNQKVPQGNEGKPNSYNWYTPKKATNGIKSVFKDVMVKNADNRTDRGDKSSNFSNTTDEYSITPLNLSQNAKEEVMNFSKDFDVNSFLYEEEAVEKELMNSTPGQEKKVEADGKPENEQNAKVKGKENMKFPRTVKIETNEVELNKRVQQKLDENEFVLALGEDPGLEDLEWSEFIGPKNSLDDNSDLTRLLGAQARQLGAVQHSCL